MFKTLFFWEGWGACFFLCEKTIKSHYQCTCIDVFRRKKIFDLYKHVIKDVGNMHFSHLLEYLYIFRKMGVGVNTNVHLEKENVCTYVDK